MIHCCILLTVNLLTGEKCHLFFIEKQNHLFSHMAQKAASKLRGNGLLLLLDLFPGALAEALYLKEQINQGRSLIEAFDELLKAYDDEYLTYLIHAHGIEKKMQMWSSL